MDPNEAKHQYLMKKLENRDFKRRKDPSKGSH